jgi:hypothetical protein
MEEGFDVQAKAWTYLRNSGKSKSRCLRDDKQIQAMATARTLRQTLYIPTHRDEAAMNGAPDRLWQVE